MDGTPTLGADVGLSLALFLLTRLYSLISVRVGVAGDVVTQIASDVRPQVEGH